MCALSQERREAGFDDGEMSDSESRPLSERVGAIDEGQLQDVKCRFLGRLRRVDLIKWVSDVRPSVHKKFFRFR